MFKFNDSGIIVLLEQIWVYAGKESYDVMDISLTLDITSQIPTVEMYENVLLFKFHNNQTVNESGVVILLRWVWVYAGKKENFRREGRENRFERKRKCINVS